MGGKHASLEAHIDAVRSHHVLGRDIDFKLARSCGPLNEDAVRESNFDRLRVVICKVFHFKLNSCRMTFLLCSALVLILDTC